LDFLDGVEVDDTDASDSRLTAAANTGIATADGHVRPRVQSVNTKSSKSDVVCDQFTKLSIIRCYTSGTDYQREGSVKTIPSFVSDPRP
jgi:hypothetical protein